MAALLLSTAGAAAGGALFGPAGAIAGRLIGAIGGNLIDNALFGAKGEQRIVKGPRLSDLDVMASTEGAPIARVYGRARLSGQVIWATHLEEVVRTRTETTGGAGGGKGGGGAGASTTTTKTYRYFANLAVGLCEGPIGNVLRVWADGKLLDLSHFTYRIYRGDETQTPDPLIVAKEGGGNAPAYRGLAYVVFERMPLEKFGNRIPQLSFEIVRPVGLLEQAVRAVTLIPGTTEFGYEPATVVRKLGGGRSAPENRHVAYADSDVLASLDELQAICPNVERVAIVVAWFGSDLRAGQCSVRPGVDNADKDTHGATWSVAGVTRGEAYVVSTIDGRPAFGGTPSDDSVTHLIAELKARGLKVTLYPLVVMDIAADNSLPDPWTGAASQPAYPWRGRITCDPAPGQAGSPDGTAAAADQVNAFFGGAGDWTYRRMVLHYADLAAAAGGVDGFFIGSELKALTRVRSASGVYPGVDQLVALAGEVKAIVGASTVVTYAADWTEYGAHVLDAGASEVRFPLDALWASPDIGAVGVDYYAPLADWRDGASHRDRAIAGSIYEKSYLVGNLQGGEAYDWFYADDAARNAQTRSDIGDSLGKPWIFRAKDLWSWWTNPHYERVGGAELPSPTAWAAQSKPIWFGELGCPAVNKGANQPSIFPDAKSSGAGFPYFSNGSRDDLIQRRYLETLLAAFDPAFGASEALNPVSSVYGGRMVDVSGIHLWTWDARPYPVFPADTATWRDGPNWATGHWLTGRLGSAPMEGLLDAMLSDAGIGDVDCSTLASSVDGYVLDRPMSPRDAIEPLALAYAFDALENGTQLQFRPRGGDAIAEIAEDDLALTSQGAPFRLVRAQETELPREVSLGFTDTGGDYRRAAVTSRRLVGGSNRNSHADLAVITNDTAAQRQAEMWLQDLWAGRETAEFALPPSALSLTPGDIVALTAGGRRRLLEIREIVDTESRAIKARSIDPEVFDLPLSPPRWIAPQPPVSIAPVQASVLDLPMLDSAEPPVLTRIAVFADPWPGAVAIWSSADGLSFERTALALAPSIAGVTLDDLPRGPTSRFDDANRVRVQLYGGALASVSDSILLGGGNAAAVQRPDGAWEVLQFANADLVGDLTYELSRFLRGQAGSEWAMADPLPAGAPFVLLDEHVVPIAQGLDMLGRTMQLRIVAAGLDYSDPATLALEATPQETALRPLSPVDIRARRTADGVLITWIRRTRIDGDAWNPGDVPLGEEREAYAVDILSGGSVLRTLNVSEASALYAAADEISDFGAPQESLSVSIAQISAVVDRGFAVTATLPFLL
ncbi:MAG TPA: glycoside hydrolase/phage tail family protein [Xanthobacteraceae bacterium]|nr:glycoside hydrolase/phage tail family protein [Xanthobacteraceae bacterium]